jgi:hypothetical protein
VNGLADFTVAAARGFFRPSANVSLDEMIALITDAISHSRELELRQLMIDTRKLTGHEPPNTFQRYYLVNRWFEASGGKIELALIVRPEMMDPQRFATKVAANRGFVFNAFLSEAEAIAWLDDL